MTTEVFAYRPSALLDTLAEIGGGDEPLADFGETLLPRLVDDGRAFEFRLESYWRDVGTPDSYWQAHQDLVDGRLDLDDLDWRIRTTAGHRPPARVDAGASVQDSLLSPACRVSGQVSRSVLSPGVVVEAGAVVESSVILHGAVIRAGAHVERAIVDSRVEVGPDTGASTSEHDHTVAIYGQTEQ